MQVYIVLYVPDDLLYVYIKVYSKEIHPGAMAFSRAKEFRAIPGRHRCYYSFSLGGGLPETAVNASKRLFMPAIVFVKHY